MAMWQAAIIVCSLVAADEVTVKPLQGPVVRGQLVSLTETTVAVQTPNGERQWELGAIQSLTSTKNHAPPAPEPAAAPPRTPSGVFVELTDGSSLIGTRVTLTQAQARLETAGGAVEMPPTAIRSIRFRPQDELLQKQWTAIAEGMATGDQLVVRKTSGEAGDMPVTVALDHLEGIVSAVTPTGIAFTYDGDQIHVALEKVEGILFQRRQAAGVPDPLCRLEDLAGNAWQVRNLRYAPGTIQLQSVAGVSTAVPWDQVVELDFTSGNLVYLSDLAPETFEWRPYLVTPATPPALAKWFSLRRDQAIDGSVLTLGGESFEKGLSIHSRTQLSYRLTKPFGRFQAVVGIDERFRGPGNVKLVISGDDRTLLNKEIRGQDPPLPLDLDLTGVRRLRILVDFGEDRSDAGDHLLLGNARLTK